MDAASGGMSHKNVRTTLFAFGLGPRGESIHIAGMVGVGVDEREVARRLFEIGRAAWPDLVLEIGAIDGYVACHSARGVTPATSYAADVYLACACACGVDGALQAFERIFAEPLARAVASIDPSRTFVEEVVQEVRVRLFVPTDGGPGKIAEYGGRASLRSWLGAVGARSAISLRRRQARRTRACIEEHRNAQRILGGPESDYLRRRYKGAFEDAVRAALARLAPKERLLLRLNTVDGLSIDRIGAIYRVSRSTAARWLATARGALLEEARRELRARCSLTSTEIDSLAAEIRSQLEVSMRTLLSGATSAQQ